MTVIIPAHHSTAYISEALESLQAVKAPLDIIVVENGSDELDIQTLQRCAGNHPVMRIHLDQADLASARNVGLDAATGQWLLFLDSDDLIDAAALDATLSIEGLEECSLINWARSNFIDGKTPAIPRDFADPVNWPVFVKPGYLHLRQQINLRDYSPIVGSYLFAHAEILRTGIRFSEGYLHEDHAFTARMIFSAPRVARTPGVVLHRRIRPDSLSAQMAPTVSAKGYRRAFSDLKHYATASSPRATAEKWAHWWLVARLSVIYHRKQLQIAPMSLPNRGGHLLFLALEVLRYVFMTVFLRAAGR